jgi:deazaflavin-dependent oxidoreductase (nitroreductase family)
MTADRKVIQSRRSGGLAIAFQRAFMKAHTALYRLTGGDIGGKFRNRNFLLLTTTGRKSGQERVTPIFYMPEAGRFLLIASNWGAPVDPQWWLNLQARLSARVQVGKRTVAVTATQADAEERARLWPLITSRYPDFADYQRRTAREIPVVILTPTV